MLALTDEELVSRFRGEQGSKSSSAWINQLFERYYAKVAAWCYRTTGDRESASDLAQEVFLKAFRHLDSFQGTAKFSTWLYVIARNHCLNYVKSKAAEPAEGGVDLHPEMQDTQGADPLQRMERDASMLVLKEMMTANLDATEIQVMTLHYREEVPLSAITRLLDLTNASGAKAYIVSARRKLNTAVQRWKAVPGRKFGVEGTGNEHD
jgi:RNA polymerase sigma-70 factor (ECF subfamily)